MSAKNWISDGEKYALVGLSLKVEDSLKAGSIGRNLWLFTDHSFELPNHWREWLGTIRSEELQSCNVFLLSKAVSSNLDVLDEENQRLQYLASAFYTGLLFASRFAPAHRPVALTGSRRGDILDVRQQKDFETPVPCTFRFYPEVFAADFIHAARLAEAIIDIPAASITGGHWRLFRALHVHGGSCSTRHAGAPAPILSMHRGPD